MFEPRNKAESQATLQLNPEYIQLSRHVDAVTKLLNFQVNAGKEVIMVMHSYGGACGSAAVQGLTKTARYISVTNPGNVFYQDVAEPLKSVSVALVKTESLAILGAVQSYAGWRDVKSTYILTTQNNVLPPSFQGFFSSQVGAFGGSWNVVPIASGHAPWLTHLNEVKNTLIDFAKSVAS
ncbi:hypothetical protein E2P81_ATG03170 [Venturia nashicola]|nr:hypothetical protein E2P81_ATG03170 [Venturia nashicola]